MTPARQFVARLLCDERDALHEELVKACEGLLEHDARVRAAQKELGNAVKARDAASAKLDEKRDQIEAIEAAYRELTDSSMPAYSPLK